MDHRFVFVLFFIGRILSAADQNEPAAPDPSIQTEPFILRTAGDLEPFSDQHDTLPWLDEQTQDDDLIFQNRHSLEAKFKGDDALTQKLALFVFGERWLNQTEHNALAKQLLALAAEQDKHPLTPYVYDAIQSSKKTNIPEKKDMVGKILEESKPSCAAIDILHERLTDKTFVHNHIPATIKYLQKLYQINDMSNLTTTLRVFASMVAPKDRKAYQGAMLPFIRRSPNLASLSPWLEQIAEDNAAPSKGNSFLKTIKNMTKRKSCPAAKQTLYRALREKPKQKPIMSLGTALASIEEVDRCLRGRGRHDRIAFWNFFNQAIEDRYGEIGWGRMQLSIARILWNQDNNTDAVKRLNIILDKNSPEIRETSYPEALFLLARIEDNEGQYPEAIKHYEELVSRFPAFEQIDEVRKMLIITSIGQGQWQATSDATKKMIAEQDAKPMDSRDQANLGFALFWAGRAALELGHWDDSLLFWKRCALELYSTYYGAVGHFMLESVLGRRLILTPTNSVALGPEFIHEAFPHDDSVRTRRIEGLLHLGLKKFARCESYELPGNAQIPNQTLAKAILLHRSGDWLESIRLYNEIPRTYRQTLPLKAERILFPKRFGASIRKYADKVQIDPHFVLSLIRQESVFNPNAYSPAGASGLMQLMTQTAKDEAKKLETSYVTAQVKQQIIRKTRERNALFEVETNLILGVHHFKSLLEKYENPLISLSAYNAGPTVTAKWLKKYDSHDPLYFVERIPYNETRNYIKLIVRNYFYYKKWYGNHNEGLVHLEKALQNLALNRLPLDIKTF